MKKHSLSIIITTFIIASTFLWSQFIWSGGIFYPLQNDITPSYTLQKNLPIKLQETFPKVSCKTWPEITHFSKEKLFSALKGLYNEIEYSVKKDENNALGQVTKYESTATIKTYMSSRGSTAGSSSSEPKGIPIDNYTVKTNITTDQVNGRVTKEHEQTIVNGIENRKEVSYTKIREREYASDGGWFEKETRSDMDLIIERRMSDLEYQNGRVSGYMITEHRYGEDVSSRGPGSVSGTSLTAGSSSLDITTQEHRHDITFDTEGRVSSYKSETWDSSAPQKITYTNRTEIKYDMLDRVISYTEEIREVGYLRLGEGGIPDGIPANLDTAISKIDYTAETGDSSGYYIAQDTSTTIERSEIQYDALGRQVGYTDVIGSETIQTSGIRFNGAGQIIGYLETRTEMSSRGLTAGSSTNQTITYVSSIEYNSLGLISEKSYTINGQNCKIIYEEYDPLGRPVSWEEEQGDITITHYNVIYNSLGEISIEYIKTEAESGGLFSSSEEALNEFHYTYDKTGERNISYQNEIYHHTESSILGTIFQAAVSAIAAVFTAGQSLWVTAAWMAGSSFVTTLAVTGDIETALLSGAISFATSVVSSFIQGTISGTLPAMLAPATDRITEISFSNLAKEFAKQLITSEIYDQVSARGPPALAYLASALASGLLSYALPMDVLKNTPAGLVKADPLTLAQIFSPQAIANHLINAGIIQLIDIAVDNGTITAQTASVLRTLASAFVAGMTYNIAEQAQTEATISELKQKGYEPIYNERGNIAGWIKGEDTSVIYLNADGSFKYSQSYDDNANLISIKEPGKTTYYDTNLTPIYALLNNGTIQSYDIYGNIEGILPSGATAQFDNNGKFIGSNNESVFGTKYYDANGNYEAWIPEGYTVRTNENGDIIGSYKNAGEGATIYRDSDGKFQYWTRETADGEVYIHDRNTVTNLRADGTTDWTKTNTPFSTINYYDADGQKITAQLMTKLDENGLIQNKIYHDLTTDEFTFYDGDGNDLGTYEARRDANGNIYAYKTIDTNGNQIIVDKNFNIRSSLAKDGTYTKYIDGEIYRVLRRESVAIVKQGVLDQDPITGKVTLYKDIGTKITDNPVILALKLNFSLFTLPTEIAQKIINDAKDLLFKAKELTIQKEAEEFKNIPGRWELFKKNISNTNLPVIFGAGVVGSTVDGPLPIADIPAAAFVVIAGGWVLTTQAIKTLREYDVNVHNFTATKIFVGGETLTPPDTSWKPETITPPLEQKDPSILDPGTQIEFPPFTTPVEVVKPVDIIDPLPEQLNPNDLVFKASNHSDNFDQEKVDKLLPKDKVILEGDPDEIVRVRHNATPEVTDKIIDSKTLKTSSDGFVYVEAPDIEIIDGKVNANPFEKEEELGIDPGKGDAGVEFEIRRGDLGPSPNPNPQTGNYDLVIKGDIYLGDKDPTQYIRK